MDFKNGVKNIQTAGYNGARTVYKFWDKNLDSLNIKKYVFWCPNI